ncbi:MAG: D-glycero-beta-D-manno-heptose 1-phosphate adenylyltransferase [Acidimicrobiales bacterium]
MNRVVVVGDCFLDRDIEGIVERVCPDAPVPVVDARSVRPRPGGAGLAAALLAADGRPVTLVSALADDDAGRELAELLRRLGVDVCNLGLDGPTPEKVRIRAAGQSLLRLDLGAEPRPVGALSDSARSCLAGAGAVLVADYGRGVAAQAGVRTALAALPVRVPIVWDPHPRGPEPIKGVRLATPNAAEAARLVPDTAGAPKAGAHKADTPTAGHPIAVASARGATLVTRWGATAVAVTLGERGALLAGLDGPPLLVPAPKVEGGDPCGAGDRFAGTAIAALADGALVSEAVEAGVMAASAFVAVGGAAAAFDGPGPSLDASPRGRRPTEQVLAEVRAAGGTVVATGGCFDLLHAGHVGMLQAARRLGDCLVVCLNNDASVRRLKGPDRPLQGQDDRAAVLLALDCVDAVAIFDEDTPAEILEQLRPEMFCKGADYAVTDLPEARTLARWGGQAIVLPYLQGRSTTRLVKEAARHAT